MILENLTDQELCKIIYEAEFKSYVIDWVKPYEYRMFTDLPGDLRLSLQVFKKCNTDVVYYHNHPWYKEMKVIKGKLKHGISTSYDTLDYINEIDVHNNSNKIKQNEFSEMILSEGAIFSIKSPNAFHYMLPITDEVYCIMINKKPWFNGPKAPHKIKEIHIEEQTRIKNVFLDKLTKKYI